MTDNLRDRIADEDEKHYQATYSEDGWLCRCGAGLFGHSGLAIRKWRLHKADAVIEALGLTRVDDTNLTHFQYVTDWQEFGTDE